MRTRLLLVAIAAACMLAGSDLLVEAAKARGRDAGASAARSSRRGGDDKAARRGDVGSSRARPARRDFDDYDEDEEDDYDVQDVRGSRRGGYGKGALVPARRGKGRGPPAKSSLLSGLASSVLEKASSMQEASKGKAMEWRKIVKGKVSSQFERFMLQLTWPDDVPVDPVFTTDMMHYLDTADDYPDEMAPTNPYRRTLRKLWARMSEKDYRRTLRKLWARMSEKDYRTVLKSLMLVHHMGIDLGPDASMRARTHILRMRKEVNSKKGNEMYFQLQRIMDVNAVGEPFVPFIKAYASYAFKRATMFVGGLKVVSQTLKAKKTQEGTAVELLQTIDAMLNQGLNVKLLQTIDAMLNQGLNVKLLQTIDAMLNQGLNVKVDRKELVTDLTRAALQYTAGDMLELWRVYAAGVQRLAEGGFAGAGGKGAKDGKQRLLSGYASTRSAVSAYLDQCKKMKLVRDLSKFEDNQVSDAALEQCLAPAEPERPASKASKGSKAAAAAAAAPAAAAKAPAKAAARTPKPAPAPVVVDESSEETEESEEGDEEEQEGESEEEEEDEEADEEAESEYDEEEDEEDEDEYDSEYDSYEDE
ncbi:hypothetical protein JKP88DRAFT_265815 [Tribonema minus]|uniref:AP180 N-terminal homology (ANTH) domain-containing protein n=1 Tax=Tribonema minus TaxID=303371 RepID=A0A835YKQ2_9STRA|nr:hypothetical protein JKP88DRAFT_265815 [Tribonema minus]